MDRTTHIYHFGLVTRAFAATAGATYGAAGLFLAAKAFAESPAIGVLTACVVAPTSVFLLYLFLYPRLDVGADAIICRMPFRRRKLLAANVAGVALTYSKNGRVVNLVPKDDPGRPLRIHPYFDTDQFFRDWLAGFPSLT